MREQRPSAAPCFLRCLGQPALIESLKLPPTTSDYAVEGSAAHRVGEECLKENIDPSDYVGDQIDVTTEVAGEDDTVLVETRWIDVTQDMATSVKKYVDWIRRESHGNVLLVEKEIDCSKVLGFDPDTGERRTGTADAIIIPKNPKFPLSINDYKHGAGVEVHAEKNFQLMIYAACFLLNNIQKLPHKMIQLVIHQPRIKVEPDIWEISREDLIEWAAKAKRRSKIVDSCKPGERLTPGEKQCQWCDAGRLGKCPAIDDVIAKIFDDIDEMTEQVIPPKDTHELADRLEKIPLVQMWCKAAQSEAYTRLTTGLPVPGHKLVPGKRGARYWVDPAQAEERLKKMRLKRDDMYKNELKSPAQIEKLITPKRYEALKDEGFIDQENGKPTMVRSDDPREGIAHDSAFRNIEDETDEK